jgi:hypothetical protein
MVAEQSHITNETTSVPLKVVVFFSWQSDIPIRGAIRSALNKAANTLMSESEYEGVKIEIDEATRGTAGSPNIPIVILEKIRNADVFVADITTINKGQETRKTPNPNVAIELGYAIGEVGWSRIIMLFNTAFGDFPNDVPFDIDRHRASQFKLNHLDGNSPELEAEKQQQAEKKNLEKLLKDALKAIIDASPKRPRELVSNPQAIRRARDVRQVTKIMSTICVPAMDLFFERVSTGQIPDHVFHFWEGFHSVFAGGMFHLYDTDLLAKMNLLHSSWEQSLSFHEHFMPNGAGDMYQFVHRHHSSGSENHPAFKQLQQAALSTKKTLGEVMDHIRKEYVEVDLQELSAVAWEEFQEWKKAHA